jgi:uncharacterized protein YjbI with pentapeptide repeats
MPTITNFGDVVTVGNAAVNGTGTSSFAGPVTFAQGVSITGAVSTSSAFYGVLAGANTAAVSALTASTNVYAPIVTTPLVNAATVQATTGFYGVLAGQNTASVTVLTASGNVNAPTVNVTSLNVSSQANVTFLNVSSTAFLSNANVATANLTSANIATGNVSVLNVASAWFTNANLATGNLTTANITTGNVSVLNVASAWFTNANLATGNLTTANITTGNVSVLNVASAWFTSANLATGNLTTANITTGNVSVLNVASAWFTSANLATGNIATANISSLNVTGDANVANVTVRSNLYASNIIMSSNLSTNTGFGNVYLTGNLVVQGNIFSLGGSVGSGSGTSQGVLYSLPSTYALGSAFATGTAGPTMNGYHLNLTSFSPEATQSVTQFGASTGMLKFTTAGLYQITCVIAADQPPVKVAVGKTTSASFPPSVTATAGYDYVYNYPTGASPSHMVTLPLSVTDTSQYYYLDVFISTVAGAPTILYPTRSTTAVGSNYGTYIQVAPFGNYLSSATGVASALLANCAGSSNLSGVYSSNAYRVTLTSANGWTVNGTSSSLAVTSNGNFQVNQAGIYEVNLCLNTTGNTPVQFQVGSLATDALVPNSTTPQYLYSYAPMYTQDPTTTIQLPLNITNVANVYFVECSFPGTVAGNVALQATSTFVSIKPIGGYISTATNPWIQQGTSVYYPSGPVGIGGVVPTALTETLTINGNTSFVGNVTVTSDASGSSYVNARRVPAGSLDVAQYVTGSVPLTTTTNLIQKYLSNAATITANTVSGTSYSVLNCPGTSNSGINFPSGGHSLALSNLALSNIFIEAWVNPSVISGSSRSILERVYPSADFYFYVDASGRLAFQIVQTSGSTTANSAAGTITTSGSWIHVAASYQRTGLTAGVSNVFINGVAGATKGTLATYQPLNTPGSNIWIGADGAFSPFTGNIFEIRVMTGSVVPTTGFAPPAFGPFTSAPTYRAGMDTGYTSNLTLALQSQYFPGASTAPYGPCLTLPGTVGSYYQQSVSSLNTTISSLGFTMEAWVNYASFANSAGGPTGSPATSYYPWTIVKANTSGSLGDWFFGVTPGGALSFYTTGTTALITANNVVTTGQWTHILAQCNGSNLYMAVNGTFQTLTGTGGYSPTGGNSTIAPTTFSISAPNSAPLTLGQYFNIQNHNYAIAKARIVLGTSGANGNVYSSGNFTSTLSPNFNQVLPSGATIAWSLDSQYPLPTYPSFFDAPQLPQQIAAYGAEPVVVGGVTSNTLSPYSTTYPQLDSVRFDGTGYIDYGNAASSVLTTNLWANAWTIEAWVYPTGTLGGGIDRTIVSRSTSSTLEFYFYVGVNTGQIGLAYNDGSGTNKVNVGSGAAALNTWTHVAATYDGTRSNVYVGGVLSNSLPITSAAYFPTSNFVIGSTTYSAFSSFLISGNLADLRVSNVARYTGSTYTVPPEPHPTNNANTLLLLRSLGGQVGTTLEIQGRGLGSTSIGATQTVRAYPPAPMSSYLLDTTSNASVTYGQGKYVASASSEYTTGSNWAWTAFDNIATTTWQSPYNTYSSSSPYGYIGSVTTVDNLGNSYPGEWVQLQMPVSVLLSSYSVQGYTSPYGPASWVLVGSRDGINWTFVDRRTGITWSGSLPVTVQTFVTSATQAYNYYRYIILTTVGNSQPYSPPVATISFNGTEESLCVTSDAKVGVGIANPQRALEVAGDLVVSGTISGGAGMGSFRNRIINGDMRIAQRGTSSTTVGYGTVDRIISGGTMTSTQTQQTLTASDTPYQLGFRNSFRATVNVGTNLATAGTGYLFPFAQNIEAYNIQDLNWGASFGVPMTVSFWIRSNIPSGSQSSVTVTNNLQGSSTGYSIRIPFTYYATSTWQYVTVSCPPPPNGSPWSTGTSTGIVINISGTNYNSPGNTINANPNVWESTTTYNRVGLLSDYVIAQTAGNYIEFTGVQLEKGTVATPFEVRPYATELALCQRYYWRLNGNAPIGTIGAYNTTNGYCTIPFPVPMRISTPALGCNTSTPPPAATTTITLSNSEVTLWYSGTSQVVTSIRNSATSTTNGEIYIVWPTAVTLNGGYLVEVAASKFIEFSAEL